jgi:hypothetical protein
LVSVPCWACTALAAAIYYLIYMQIEAYVVSPRVMSRAVSVPGGVVVVAAHLGDPADAVALVGEGVAAASQGHRCCRLAAIEHAHPEAAAALQ